MSKFLEFIGKLRAKPEETRRQITFWLSAGLTLVVALVWLASLSFTLRPPANSQVAGVKSADADHAASATSTENSWLSENKTRIIEGWKVIMKN